MAPSPRINPSVGKWALVSLTLGLALGVLGQTVGLRGIRAFSDLIAPFGTVWIRALQMVVLPLVVTQLLASLARVGSGGSVARLGGRTVGLSLVYLVGGGLLLVLVAGPVLGHLYHPPDLGSILTTEAVPQTALEAAERGTGSGAAGIMEFVPTNVVQAAAQGQLLQVILFTILLGLAASRLPESQRKPLAELLRTLADAVMIMVGWVLMGTPVGVFSLALAFGLELGLGAVGLLAFYVVALSGILLAFTLLIYLLTAVAGRVSLRTFARAVLPAQVVAAGTQSSLASLPALVEGGKRQLKLPEEYTGFALPFCVTTFRFNAPVSETFNLLLLGVAFGVPLTPAQIGVFMVGIVILSFSISGLPRGGGAFQSLPFYLVAGIPIEGVVLVEMVKTIPDVFFTLYNVTAHLSVPTILSAGSRRRIGPRELLVRERPDSSAPLPVVLGGRRVVKIRRKSPTAAGITSTPDFLREIDL